MSVNAVAMLAGTLLSRSLSQAARSKLSTETPQRPLQSLDRENVRSTSNSMAMRLVSSCCFFILLAVICSQEGRWVTTNDLTLEAFTFTRVVCPNATPVAAIRSTYIINSDRFADRQWQFRCVLPTNDFIFQWGAWLNTITHLKRDFTLVCPPNTFIGGVAARFFFNSSDSLWDVLCNHLPEGYELGQCTWTSRTNTIYGNLTLNPLQQKRVIIGMESSFSRYLDRIWSYRICIIRNVTCLEPTIPNQRRPRDKWTSGSLGPKHFPWNTSIHFSCRHGFFLLGSQEATCTINGTWTALPSCKACPTIPHCADVHCTSLDHAHCLRCVSYHHSGLPLRVSKDWKRCQALPVIHPLAQTIVFTLGETILVPCQAWGHPKPTVSWYQEGEQVGEDGRVQQVNGSLLIRNASFADEGEFQCFATNRAGVDSVNITLFMTAERPLEAPTIVNWTEIHWFPTGSTALVMCEATGHPPPTITWSRDHRDRRSVPIPTQFNLRVHQFWNGTLGFFPAFETDSGVYTCFATNQVDTRWNQTVVYVSDPSVEISGGSIKVPEAPGFLSASASGSAALESTSGAVEPSSSGELPSTPDIVDWVYEYIVVEGTTLQLPCHAIGFPPPQVNWISRGVEVGRKGEEEGVRVYPNGSLIILNIGGDHLQFYKCIAWNVQGLTYRAVAVTIVTASPEVSPVSELVTTSHTVAPPPSSATATPSAVPTSPIIVIETDCEFTNYPSFLLIFLLLIVCVTIF